VSRRWARILLREWGSATAPVPGADDPRGQGHLRSTTRRLLTQKPRSKPLDERFVTVIQSVRGCSPLWCMARTLFVLMTQCRLPPLGVDVVGHGLLPDR
jgi:hypothetical protein